MKNLFALLFSAVMVLSFNQTFAQADKIVGTWKTIDDNNGKAVSYVKIFKATNGMYYGKVIKLLSKPSDTKCTECKGDLKNKPMEGLQIINEMKEKKGRLEDGKILDPGNGKFYYCTIELDSKNKDLLKVRGSLDAWGMAGRTQIWHRLK